MEIFPRLLRMDHPGAPCRLWDTFSREFVDVKCMTTHLTVLNDSLTHHRFDGLFSASWLSAARFEPRGSKLYFRVLFLVSGVGTRHSGRVSCIFVYFFSSRVSGLGTRPAPMYVPAPTYPLDTKHPAAIKIISSFNKLKRSA